MKQNFELMANYNQLMNCQLYDAAHALESGLLHQDMGAYFQSIFGSLNHIAVADIIWLKRFSVLETEFRSLAELETLSHPESLSEVLCDSLEDLTIVREMLDSIIIGLTLEAQQEDFQHLLPYIDMDGIAGERNFGLLLHHFFNHQTHHRGQVSTLFSQVGVDVGVTDLLQIIPNVAGFVEA